MFQNIKIIPVPKVFIKKEKILEIPNEITISFNKTNCKKVNNIINILKTISPCIEVV